MSDESIGPPVEPLQSASFVAVAVTSVVISVIAEPNLAGVLGGALGVSMFAIAAIDARVYVIPNRLTAAAYLLALADAGQRDVATAGHEIGLTVTRSAIFGLVFFCVHLFYRRLRHVDGLGMGDVKLAAVAGAWLDWRLAPLAIELGAAAALFAWLARMTLRGEALRSGARMPFGLFLAPSIWLCWLYQAGNR